MLTVANLKNIFDITEDQATMWLPYFNSCIDFAELNTTKRLACFLAQVGHESGRLRYSREIWSNTLQQQRYEGTSLAKRLGNINKGDGFKYRGRGLIQITGRYNYRELYKSLSKYFTDTPNFEEEPDKLTEAKWSSLAAAMYWKKRNLNKFADNNDFIGLTKAINGGINGLEDRQELYIRALAILA